MIFGLKSRMQTWNKLSAGKLSKSILKNENDCHICYENIAIYAYYPCQHCPMCGECSVKLTSKQHEQCIFCYRQAKITEIHSRALTNYF